MSSSTIEEQGQQQQQQTQAATSTTPADSGLTAYFNALDSKYQEKVKSAAQQEKYTLQLTYGDGRTEKQEYVRMKVLQWQFDDIQEMIAKIQDYGNTGQTVLVQKISKTMYEKAATYYLFNTQTKKPMSLEEYKHCYSAELRPVLDAAIRLTLLSDPN